MQVPFLRLVGDRPNVNAGAMHSTNYQLCASPGWSLSSSSSFVRLRRRRRPLRPSSFVIRPHRIRRRPRPRRPPAVAIDLVVGRRTLGVVAVVLDIIGPSYPSVLTFPLGRRRRVRREETIRPFFQNQQPDDSVPRAQTVHVRRQPKSVEKKCLAISAKSAKTRSKKSELGSVQKSQKHPKLQNSAFEKCGANTLAKRRSQWGPPARG